MTDFPDRGTAPARSPARRLVSRIAEALQLPTRLTSIDPTPRRHSDAICDRTIRKPLEACDLTVFDELQAGDILSFDGSHRAFTNSDVTAFLFEVLPRLNPGVTVHIHDIFIPDD